MTTFPSHLQRKQRIQTGRVIQNRQLCRSHFRLTARVSEFDDAEAGQFVHLCPIRSDGETYALIDGPRTDAHAVWWKDLQDPLLRRAFSIARLIRNRDRVEIDVIYRVVGTATRWLESLQEGDELSVMGPLGQPFPIAAGKSNAWLVAGGVGLPPLLWLAEALQRHGKSVVAFCGAQTRDLLALDLDDARPPTTSGRSATFTAREFAELGAPVVISTDEGSFGFHGHVGAALIAYAAENTPPRDDLVVYTCGPERMMRFVAQFCEAREMECYVCVERNMACGTGMCQSCIVPIHDECDTDRWRYSLCCTEGPVFPAKAVLWDH